jgi:hypothetical protein
MARLGLRAGDGFVSQNHAFICVLTALVAAPVAAHAADYFCKPAPGSASAFMKEVVATDLFYDGRRWSIAHHLASGGVAVRNDQYDLRDSSVGASEGRWEGNLRKNSRLHMVGHFESSGRTYIEDLFNGRELIMRAVEDCQLAQTPVTVPAPAPTPAAQTPTGGLGAFDHRFGSTGDGEAVNVLAAFGDITVTCGNPMVDYEMEATIDPHHLPPTVKVYKTGNEDSPDYPITRMG